MTELAAAPAIKNAAEDPRVSSREFGMAYLEQPDGDPIIGLQYVTDYRAEEEYGVGELRTAITGKDPFNFAMTPATRIHAGTFSDVNAIYLTVKGQTQGRDMSWGETFSRWSNEAEYANWWTRTLAYKTESKMWGMRYKKMAEVRAIARELGISPLPRTKDGLLSAIAAHPDYAVEVNAWPGWFHYGDVLVLRADEGVVADTIRHLANAIRKGTLALGNASGPFSTGLFLYDADDETEALRRERRERIQWHEDRMAEIEPVRQAFKDAGWHVYFLGNPRFMSSRIVRGEDGSSGSEPTDPYAVYFWLNASPPRGKGKQNSGWMNAEELLALATAP